MTKTRISYVCQNCGAVHARWNGKCDACNEWNTLVEEKAEAAPPKGLGSTRKSRQLDLVDLQFSQEKPLTRAVTGLGEFDRVTGGGLVPGCAILLGGDPGTAEEAAAVLSSRYPGLKIAGLHCPSFGFEKDARALRHIEKLLTDASPDIVYVALGSPKQEKLIASLRGKMYKLTKW